MRIKLLPLFLLLATFAQAQYTYISDRRFFEPADLLGYDFKPAKMEVQEEMEQDLSAGEYSFGITLNNLYVKGGDIEGVYNINNIQPEDYGFKLLLINARDARLQGHLKFIINKYGMVEVLIFKRSPSEKEIIFYLNAISKKLKEQEAAHFTDRGELAIMGRDSVWGKSIYPFLILHQDAKVQQRMQMEDSLCISFVEKITITEKEVKKKRNKDEEAQAAADSLMLDSIGLDLTGLDSATVDSILSAQMPEKKIKITKEYFVTIKSNLVYDDGLRQTKTVKYPVKRVVEKEDEAAGQMEERFRWEFTNDKKELIYLYLNGDHTVSSFHVGPKQYLMRGF